MMKITWLKPKICKMRASSLSTMIPEDSRSTPVQNDFRRVINTLVPMRHRFQRTYYELKSQRPQPRPIYLERMKNDKNIM
jgi:hypothetical protein